MSAKVKQGPGRPPVVANAILVALKANPGATIKELQLQHAKLSMPLMVNLKKKGLIAVSGSRQTGTKGRPQSEFKLTPQGHNRVKSVIAKANKTVTA